MIFNRLFLLLVGAATALGSPVVKRQGDELLPSHIYNYDAGSGAISCASSGVIKKVSSLPSPIQALYLP
jgi:hypothetical protein